MTELLSIANIVKLVLNDGTSLAFIAFIIYFVRQMQTFAGRLTTLELEIQELKNIIKQITVLEVKH